mgnify:CR=1 FL=1
MIESLPEFVAVLVTCESAEQGEKIARGVLEKHLAACVNILPGAKSLYWWEGKIDQAAECVLIIKTRESRIGDLTAEIRRLHSYSVPEVIAMRIEGGNPDYLRWLADETVDNL